MNVKRISEGLSVSPQISSEDVEALKAQGFRAIICNRPDGEGQDQPDFAEIEAAARAAGLEARYLPVKSGMVTDENAEAFSVLLAGLPRPVLAYCRSGMRSATLWSLGQAGKRPLPDILAATLSAGFDLTGMAERIASASEMSKDNAGAQQ